MSKQVILKFCWNWSSILHCVMYSFVKALIFILIILQFSFKLLINRSILSTV
ncbi:unnamed protein product [Spirodela intermedia]|uniref:Uncharacterized protein n=2 Tax=Spirodela intermedia TaxID=51605 RepID=A0A7I8KQD6_SPIIN|nr:unnamed protein product [Spirodela intermedia]CAA6663546.1 unnamed protein product [Spirodela intermedia]CAA7400033.1 unnamed protein product [Spirodela intermedia]